LKKFLSVRCQWLKASSRLLILQLSVKIECKKMSRASSDGMATTSVGTKVQQLFEQTKYLLIFF
jgi:hypothetical protein